MLGTLLMIVLTYLTAGLYVPTASLYPCAHTILPLPHTITLPNTHMHMHSLATALVVCASLGKYRVPEPVRLADKISRAYLRDNGYTAAD